MKIIFFIFLAIIFSSTIGLQAQENLKKCKTPEMNRIELENNPEYMLKRQTFENAVSNYILDNPKDNQVYIIPVVFHIVHNYGEENISKEQIEDQIRIWNLDYRLLNSDTIQIIDEFKEIAADCEIEFRLAKLDPDGNCTDGITRTVSEETYNGGETIKEIAPSWNRSDIRYLNVWVVNRIPGGVAGYSYYPGYLPYNREGILITYSYVGSIEAGTSGRSRTLTHEVGHFFDLPHPWGSTNEPGMSGNCEIDDGIEDTPNTIGHTSCNIYAVTCGSLDNVQNYMDYSYCCKMFTEGQATRMHAALNTDSDRYILWQESNLINTGTQIEDAIAICNPICDFSQDLIVGCEDIQVEYYDLSYNTDVIDTYYWEFEGGVPANSDQENPIISYPNAGKYNVTLTVSNDEGNNSKTRIKTISIYNPDDALDLPYAQDLEEESFPNIPNSDNNDFYFIDEGNEHWTRTNAASSSGTYSMRINNKQNDINTTNGFVCPSFFIDTLDFPVRVFFDVAYSKVDVSTNDALRIYVSQDCGKTWIIQYYKAGTSLQTTDDFTATSLFIPEEDEWKEEYFDINPSVFHDANSLKIKFETLGKGGHTMYIDNIEVTSMATNKIAVAQIDAGIYPNPFSNELYIETYYPDALQIEIMDISGRSIAKSNIPEGNTKHDISTLIPQNINGLFIIRITSKRGSAAFKVQKY